MNYGYIGYTYVILAILLCTVYYGLEKYKDGINFTKKCILSCWAIVSLMVISIIFAVKLGDEKGKVQNKHIAFMYIISIGTLMSSSLCVNLAI